MWCHVCRDSVSRSEDNVVECTACPKRFHLECLQQEGIVTQGEVVDLNSWLCPQCLEEAEEDEIANDDKCFLCRKVRRSLIGRLSNRQLQLRQWLRV